MHCGRDGYSAFTCAWEKLVTAREDYYRKKKRVHDAAEKKGTALPDGEAAEIVGGAGLFEAKDECGGSGSASSESKSTDRPIRELVCFIRDRRGNVRGAVRIISRIQNFEEIDFPNVFPGTAGQSFGGNGPGERRSVVSRSASHGR